jgi:hypothetical protein
MLYSMVRVKRGLTLVCPEVVADLLSQWRALQRSRGEQVGIYDQEMGRGLHLVYML